MSDNKQYSTKAKEAAEKKLRTQALHKDYWSVYEFQDNSEELQEIIDVLFNSVEGNNYVVGYLDSQNGTRLVIHCKVCAKELTSFDPFITHENGKNHKKVRQKMLSVQDPNLDGDLQIQPLNKQRGTFSEGTLEDKIDSTSSCVLGIQFVYKEIIDDRETYTCQLCQRSSDVYQISSSRMFTHLTSTTHNQNYLEAKFGYVKKSSKDFEDECSLIEEFEGKIHVKIVDLTSESSERSRSHRSHSRARSMSVSPPSERVPKTPKIESPEAMDSDDAKENNTKPQTSDVGATADISEARDIFQEVKTMQDPDCQKILQDDNDMQDLLKETLWVLANKMEKYYIQTGATYTDSEGRKIPLSVSAEKVKQYIAEFAGLN